MSCIADVSPDTVRRIYKDVFKQDLENVEEIIKNIPGFGYWKEFVLFTYVFTLVI